MNHIPAVIALTLFTAGPAAAQGAAPFPRTLVAVFAHGDDESAAAPILARTTDLFR